MRFNKCRIGQIIKVIDERNSYGIKTFYGININKEFMPTVANTEGLDEGNYKVVRKNRFVFSGMQTGRDECIRLSMYLNDKPIIVSPAYTTFEVIKTDIVLPTYFFMIFCSKEKDRLGWFYSDGSIRSNLDWNRFCDIELNIPDLAIQQKYVDIYEAMVANQQSYERGLEDLKLVCDGYIEDLRRKIGKEPIGSYIAPIDERNTDIKITLAQGITIEKVFASPKQVAVAERSAKIVRHGQFAYNRATTRNGEKISIAYRNGEDCVVSSAYQVFEIKRKNELIPEYLMMWFKRSEFDRYARYMSKGSAHEFFEYSDMEEVQIPIPDIKVQKAIAEIFTVYTTRKQINERLKEKIKNICPILIRGSLEEK
ncbi:restriction endonuclease S subunits [Clostridium sp. CAG:678]|nr:restriction endonuclease S subunits [Clostridium sp. CAG:678]